MFGVDFVYFSKCGAGDVTKFLCQLFIFTTSKTTQNIVFWGIAFNGSCWHLHYCGSVKNYQNQQDIRISWQKFSKLFCFACFDVFDFQQNNFTNRLACQKSHCF